MVSFAAQPKGMVYMKVGDKVVFGKYEWRILDISENRALIITEHIIEQRPYHNKYKDVTWSESALREYLNSGFLETFEKADRDRIIPVTNINQDNQWYGTHGGPDTRDFIFLLSLEEVCKYFGDSLSKLYYPGKNQRYWFERKDENNVKRIAKLEGKEGAWWWWLRSPGRVNLKAVYIFGTDGNIGIQGNNVLKGNLSDGKCTGGVRPALWLTV